MLKKKNNPLVTLECDVYLKTLKYLKILNTVLTCTKYCLYFMWTPFDLANVNELSPLRQCANLTVCYGWQIFIIKLDDQYYLNSDITIPMNCRIKELLLIIVCHFVNNHSKHLASCFSFDSPAFSGKVFMLSIDASLPIS